MADSAALPALTTLHDARDLDLSTQHAPQSPTERVDREDADTCRICRGEGSAEEPLFYPCKCSGSIKYVHQECLMEWLSHTQKKHCELCKTSFRFTKLYHPGMPNRIPTTIFLRRAAWHVFQMFVTWCRGVLVGSVWLFLLPLCMRVVWRSLFWVGDGGWARDMFASAGDLTSGEGSTTISTEIRSALDAAKAANTSENLTFNRTWPIPAQNTSAPSFNVYSFAKGLLFGTYPFSHIAKYTQITSGTNQTSFNATLDPLGLRSPSLLSDVPFLHWFKSQAANRFIIDVLEGQIITLFVVVAFILIFLIREWVVQQQPVINMVALGENAVAQAPAPHEHHAEIVRNEEEDEAIRELEAEILEEDLEDEEIDRDAELLAQEPTIRRVRSSSSLRRHREELLGQMHLEAEHGRNASTQGQTRDSTGSWNETTESEALNRGEVDHNARRSQTEISNFPARTSSLPDRQREVSDAIDLLSQRPNMPSRDRSFIATEIQRSLEEGQDWSFDGVPGPSQSSKHTDKEHGDDSDSWEDDDSQNPDHNPQSSQGGVESENSSESWQQISDVLEGDSNQVLEGAQPQDKGKAAIVGESARGEPNRTHSVSNDDASLNAENGAESEEVDHGSSGDAVTTNYEQGTERGDQTQAHGQPAAGEGQDAAQAAPVDDAPAQDPVDRLVDWMFRDVAPAAPAAEDGGNDEHVVRDIAEEAPFVPFVANEPRENGNVPAQDPDVAAAAAEAGIDVNDQEAIEDAEDLEGILELIGMQGPLVGLFQNALFSAVLISATLCFAVWLPYLWGKVVILFMGSPVSLFIKLPLRIIASITDVIVDITLVLVGSLFFGFYQFAGLLLGLCISLCTKGNLSRMLDFTSAEHSDRISSIAQSVVENAMDRIRTLLEDSALSSHPESFWLSINSHAALRTLQHTVSTALSDVGSFIGTLFEHMSAEPLSKLMWTTLLSLPRWLQSTIVMVINQVSSLMTWIWTSKSYKITLDLNTNQTSTATYAAMERWTASDRMIAILTGYGFFAVAGAVYLKRAYPISTSQQGQKIERIISDILQQAGGVLKVILIISIEMLVFPLYCGLLLDVAMLPLFKNASLYTRWKFAGQSPWTSGFVHWFIGTCYMFHFALFVSMCRKIMRKGVLYFIRDPDDPTFHPVRDVLERSVTTQLRKIAFSALVYGALVIVCLGGVIWTLSRVASDVLPIHWTTEAPSLEFPLDLLFYNFLTPVIIKFYKPNEGLNIVYQWWFKKCARVLRLSDFLFGDKIEDEVSNDGRYVRAPASDQARIPKGQEVFVEVDKDNVRKDGKTEGGVHNNMDLVTMVYIPSWFRVRIFAFVVAIWMFMGVSGVSVTILPLLFGRYLFSLALPPTVEMNDIHAFSLGIYTLGSLSYSAYHAYKFLSSLNRAAPDPMATLHHIAETASRVGLSILRFTYVWASLVFLVPFLFAVLIELYFLMPLHAYIGPTEPHVVHLIQDWTLGFLYSRLAARIFLANRHSRPARAFNAVIRDGYMRPNARIATRAFIVPVMALFVVAIALPSSLAFLTSRTLYLGANDVKRSMVWRFSFPAVGLSLACTWASREILRLLIRWRLVVKDEVYLIGERLHNFGEKKAPVPAAPAVANVESPEQLAVDGAEPPEVVADLLE